MIPDLFKVKERLTQVACIIMLMVTVVLPMFICGDDDDYTVPIQCDSSCNQDAQLQPPDDGK